MRRELFVDTSAWIAVSDLRDKYHPFAREEYNRLLSEQWAFVTTNLVVSEAYTIIRRTGGHEQAMRFLRSLRGSPRVIKLLSNSELETQAEEILAQYIDQVFSYVDAVSFSVMKDRGIQEAFSFDRHFAAMGFLIIPADWLQA